MQTFTVTVERGGEIEVEAESAEEAVQDAVEQGYSYCCIEGDES